MIDLVARRDTFRRTLTWAAYPLTMLLAFVFFAWGVALGNSSQLSAYLAAILAAALISWLEFINPHVQSWRGHWRDVRSDAAYIVFVQVLLPFVLGLSLSLELLHLLERLGFDPAVFWPHRWPLALQVLLMLLVADFLRYWLHVAAHKYPPLWRLHAVHHSPDKLYWLNVGRFHPLEKALQYLFDALPFILMGVNEEVLAAYFVFYATNGFFQHSNIELRFGFLNYVISSAELHRWHHSPLAEESNHNYGNNLIVWDLLFGTRFLPEDREIAVLGLLNRSYPMSFAAQLKTPLIRGIERRQLPNLTWRDVWLNFWIWLRMTQVWHTDARRLRRAASAPARMQAALLRRIIGTNAETQFGRDHRFKDIRSTRDFRRLVPVQDYESLRPYIEIQERDGSLQLTSEPPLLYTRTSGTTGEPKYVPVLASTLTDLRRDQRVFASFQFHRAPEAYYGRYLAVVSPAVEGQLPSGKPYGSTSGHVYRSMPRAARAKYLIPWELFEISDYDLKYLLILRLTLVETNLTHMASANPTTFLKLAEMLATHRTELLTDIRAGSFSRAGELPDKVRAALVGRWSCSAGRLDELERLLRLEQPTFADVWPYLALVTTWTSGSCQTALAALRPQLPRGTIIADPGYLASEFRGTITIDIEHELGLPTLTENFFEFVEVGDWASDEPTWLALHELEPGHDYYVIVTTAAGLYRYFINDIVTVTGRYRNTPTIRFVQKGKGVTNIAGEKLYEGQVIAAVNAAAERFELPISYFIMLADVENWRYRLLVEPCDASAMSNDRFLASVEASLCAANLEYRNKLASGRLKPMQCHRLRPGTREQFKRSQLKAGQREGQFKEPALAYAGDFDFAFADCCE